MCGKGNHKQFGGKTLMILLRISCAVRMEISMFCALANFSLVEKWAFWNESHEVLIAALWENTCISVGGTQDILCKSRDRKLNKLAQNEWEILY